LTFAFEPAARWVANVKSTPLVVTSLAKPGHRLRMQNGTVAREAAEDHAIDRGSCLERLGGGSDRNPRGAVGGKPIDTGGDGWKGHRRKTVELAELDRARIAGGKLPVFAATAIIPDGSDRVNHMTCRQTICRGDFGAAGLAAAERAALFEKLRPGGTMDGSINPTASEQRGVRGVDDGVNTQGRNVGNDDFQPRRAERPASEV